MLACSSSPTRLIQVCTPETSLPPEVIVLLATDPWRSESGGGGLLSEQMLGTWENWPGAYVSLGAQGRAPAGSTMHSFLSVPGFRSPHWQSKVCRPCRGVTCSWAGHGFLLQVRLHFTGQVVHLNPGTASYFFQAFNKRQASSWAQQSHFIKQRSHSLQLRLEPPKPETNRWECGSTSSLQIH